MYEKTEKQHCDCICDLGGGGVNSSRLDFKGEKVDKTLLSCPLKVARSAGRGDCSGQNTSRVSLKYAAFTIAEMMIVLLIVSIVLAVMAPLMTTKMRNDAVSSGQSPWAFLSGDNSASAYLRFSSNNEQVAMIGQQTRGANDNAKLIINAPTNATHMQFKNGNTTLGRLYMDDSKLALGNIDNVGASGNTVIGIGATMENSGTIKPKDNVVIGYNAKTASDNTDKTNHSAVAVGAYAKALGRAAIAIGRNAKSNGFQAIAIGSQLADYAEYPPANANAMYTIAIGSGVNANSVSSLAIGYNAKTECENPGTDTNCSMGGALAIGSKPIVKSSEAIAIGYGAKAHNRGTTAIGPYAETYIERSVALGRFAKAGFKNTGSGLGIEGITSSAGDYSSIAIGSLAHSNKGGIAIGISAGSLDYFAGSGYEYSKVNVMGENSIAIGRYACAHSRGSNKVCIGNGSGPRSNDSEAAASNSEHIMYLGKGMLDADNYKVVVQNLQVMGSILDKNGNPLSYTTGGTVFQSDRRLKYVGSENKSGLDKIRQLKVFNYTFKKDKEQTPRVGVIAQDLQKVFPNAVKKGSDGFLTIRLEDMFYAVINAIKELDARLTKFNEILRSAQNDIKVLKEDNARLKKENAELKARLDRLEAKLK